MAAMRPACSSTIFSSRPLVTPIALSAAYCFRFSTTNMWKVSPTTAMPTMTPSTTTVPKLTGMPVFLRKYIIVAQRKSSAGSALSPVRRVISAAT